MNNIDTNTNPPADVFVVVATGDDTDGQEPVVFTTFSDALDFAKSDDAYDDDFAPDVTVDAEVYALVDYGDYRMTVNRCKVHVTAL